MTDLLAFDLLGPFRLRRGERPDPVEIGADKPRALLAALLLGAGRVQSIDRLVTVLWYEDPPASARNLVSGYVGDLRRLLGPTATGGAAIETRPGGYRMRVDASRVDVHRFQELAAAGRTLLAAGEPAAAAERLATACALWRGPALADVRSRLLHETEVPRLDDLRREAEEARAEARLRTGRAEEEVPRLAALRAEYPLSEALMRLQVRALHLAGRRAEALAAYERAATTLRDELDLEPGTELRAVVAGVRDDPGERDRAGGDGPDTAGERGRGGPADDPAAPGLPAELPPDLADFTGRTPEAATLARLLATDPATGGGADDADDGSSPPATVALVTGPAGIGKTALAVRCAWRARASFPDGQLVADLGAGRDAPADPADALAGFLTALGVRPEAMPATTAARVRLYRSLTCNRRLLVLLDDAADQAQLRDLLPSGPGCRTVITSRSPHVGPPGAVVVPLDVFALDDAVALMHRLAGTERAGAEPGATLELVRLCGQLPLGLRVAGARLAARPDWRVADLVARLRDEHRRLDELVAGDTEVRAGLLVTYRACTPQARRAFRRLGLVTTPEIPDWVAAALLAPADGTAAAGSRTGAGSGSTGDEPAGGTAGEVAVERALDELVTTRLVAARSAGPGAVRYRCHDLLLAFARERLAAEEPAADRTAALRGLFDVAAAAANAASRAAGELGPPVAGLVAVPQALRARIDADPIAWFRSERDVLAATVASAAHEWRAGRLGPQPVWRLGLVQVMAADVAADHAHRGAVLRLALEAADGAAARTADGTSTDGTDGVTAARVAVRVALGELYLDEWRWPEAERHVREAVALAVDPVSRIEATRLRGVAALAQGHGDEAVPAFEAVLAAYRKRGDEGGQLRALRSLALAHHIRGDGRLAARQLRRCRPMAERAGYPWTAFIRTDLARVYRRAGRPADALDELAEVLPLFTAHRANAWRGAALRETGESLLALGRPDEALEPFARAREIFVRVGDLHWRGYIDCGIGDTYRAQGRLDEAAGAYQAAAQVLALYDDPRGATHARSRLADLRERRSRTA